MRKTLHLNGGMWVLGGDETWQVGSRIWDDRIITAWCFASANPSPPPPMLFFLFEPFSRSPTASVFSIPNTINTHPRCLLFMVPIRIWFTPSPPIHKEQEGRQLRKKSRPRPEGTIELVDIHFRMKRVQRGRSALSDDDVGCGFCGWTSPTPPCPWADTHSTFSVGVSAPVMTATVTMHHAYYLRKVVRCWWVALCVVKRWGLGRPRGISSTPSEVIGGFLFKFFYKPLF